MLSHVLLTVICIRLIIVLHMHSLSYKVEKFVGTAIAFSENSGISNGISVEETHNQ